MNHSNASVYFFFVLLVDLSVNKYRKKFSMRLDLKLDSFCLERRSNNKRATLKESYSLTQTLEKQTELLHERKKNQRARETQN